MANSDNNIASQNEIVLGENEMVCSLTNRVVKATDKEMTLQSMIAMMTEEYGFAPEDMERDYKVKYDDAESGKTKHRRWIWQSSMLDTLTMLTNSSVSLLLLRMPR